MAPGGRDRAAPACQYGAEAATEWYVGRARSPPSELTGGTLYAFLEARGPSTVHKFRHEDVLELHRIAVEHHLDRVALLAGMAPAFVSSLPLLPSPAQQLLSDLHQV